MIEHKISFKKRQNCNQINEEFILNLDPNKNYGD